MLHPKSAPWILIGTVFLVFIAWAFLAPVAPAAPLYQGTPTPSPEEPAGEPTRTPVPNLSISDEYCLSCHGQPGQTFTLGNGELLDLYVPAELHQNSVHGQTGIACAQCHADVGEYPHPEWQAVDRRDATLKLNAVCQRCHNHQYELAQDGVHVSVRASGDRAGATCSDCHTAHEIPRLNDPQTHELLPEAKVWIPQRCGLCHSTIYEKYKGSVHGAALTEGNPDVPTCIDCHGVHNMEDPRTAAFRLQSPQMCGQCHADEALMEKYGISTDVFETYVADFHGTTVTIFEQQHPDAEVNQAVCYDCHGVHDIGPTDDPEVGLQMQENLLATCQACHPDATTNFTAAWMSHYIPSPENYAVVYYVELFYKIFIPVVLGGMALLVVMDASRTAINRRKKRARLAAKAPPADETPASPEIEPGASPEKPSEQAGEETGEEAPAAQTDLAALEESPEKPGESPVIETAEEPGDQPLQAPENPLAESSAEESDTSEPPSPQTNDPEAQNG
jgi:hypothetical protein